MPESVRNAFGDVLRELREQRMLTQERLAFASGIDRSFISLLERGVNRATLDTLWALAEALEVSPSAVVQQVEQRLPSPGGAHRRPR